MEDIKTKTDYQEKMERQQLAIYEDWTGLIGRGDIPAVVIYQHLCRKYKKGSREAILYNGEHLQIKLT